MDVCGSSAGSHDRFRLDRNPERAVDFAGAGIVLAHGRFLSELVPSAANAGGIFRLGR